MRPLRIVHVNPSFHPAFYYGGPTASGFETVTSLARLGHEVRVLTTNADGPARVLDVDTSVELELERGLRVRYCRRVSPESVSPRLLAELPSLLRWADVVHLTAVYNFTTFPTLAGARASAKPLIWTPRGAFLRGGRSQRAVAKDIWDRTARALIGRPCAIHATSAREADASRARMPGIRVFEAPNGVKYPITVWHRPSSKLRLLALGRVDPVKGLEVLIDALAVVRERTTLDWELGIVGSGSAAYVATLRHRLARHGISDRVRFEGHLEATALGERFAHADALVAPSHSENFGMAIAEALAHGVPVIASEHTPWQGLIAHDAGLWVSNDPETLALAIQEISRRDRIAMGTRGRSWVLRDFSWAQTARRLTEEYEGLLRPHRSTWHDRAVPPRNER